MDNFKEMSVEELQDVNGGFPIALAVAAGIVAYFALRDLVNSLVSLSLM